MEYFVRMDVFLLGMVVLLVWNVFLFYVAYSMVLKLRDSGAKTKTELASTKALLIKSVKAFNACLDRLRSQDARIQDILGSVSDMELHITETIKRASSQSIGSITPSPTPTSTSVRKPKRRKMPETSESEGGEKVTNYSIPEVPIPSHTQRRGNPTGRVQL